MVTTGLVRSTIEAQMAVIAEDLGSETFDALPFDEARSVFEQVSLSSEFIEFLTLPAYELLD
jgi:malate synthase